MADVPVVPSAPVPSQFSPKPAAPAPVAPAPVAKPPEADVNAERAKMADERKAQELKMVRQQRKYSDELKAKEKTWGEKLSKLSELEKLHSQAKLNPEAFLKGVYGDGWYDAVVQAKINGGAPTADVLASEIAKVEEKFEAKLAAKDAERAKADALARQQSAESARAQLGREAAGFWRANGKEFPAIESLGNEEQVSRMLTQRIEARYNSTSKRDEEGRLLEDGQILTMKEAAEELEAEILALAEKAVAAPKYADRFKPKPAVAAQSHAAQPPRRTLSNDLTGSTQSIRPPANASEKRAREIAAYEAARRKS